MKPIAFSPGPANDRVRAVHLKRFIRLAAGLDQILQEIREYEAEANIYLEDSGNFNLLVGPSHSDATDPKPQFQNVAYCVNVRHSGGGGW